MLLTRKLISQSPPHHRQTSRHIRISLNPNIESVLLESPDTMLLHLDFRIVVLDDGGSRFGGRKYDCDCGLV